MLMYNSSATWSTFGTSHIMNEWSWRIPSILQGIPALLQFLFVLFAPESPRWLISKGKNAQALRILAYYHADGNEDDALVQYEFQEIKAAIEMDRTGANILFTSSLFPLTIFFEVSANTGWKSLIATAGNRKRMILIVAIAFFSQWSGNSLVSYYLRNVLESIGITSSTIQLLINGYANSLFTQTSDIDHFLSSILAIWNLCWAVLASFLCERLGRRFLFITSAAGMLIFFTFQTICSAQYALHGSAASAHAVIAFIFLFYASYE